MKDVFSESDRWLTRTEWMAALSVGVGVLLRLRLYLANRSLWFDEALLTLNILHRDFGGLLQPLDYNQGAPPGFLFVLKACVQVFGNSEYALRLVPFLSGVLSLVGFYCLARRVLQPHAMLIAVGLYAVVGSLIVYSAEAKQYSSDALFTVVLAYVCLVFAEEGWTWRDAACFAVVGATVVWFSHPAIFVLAGMIVCSLLLAVRVKSWSEAIKLVAVSVLVLASFAALYVVSLRDLSQHRHLLNLWKASFAPVFPITVSNYRWYFESFFDVFASSLRFYLPGVAALAFLLGCVMFFRRDRHKLCVFVSPLLFALLAAALHRYPFTGRFLLFAAPLLLLLVAQGAYWVWEATRSSAPVVGSLFLVLLFLPSVLVAVTDAIGPKGQEEVREALAYLDSHWEEGDILYVHYGARASFRYYIERDPSRITNYVYGALVGDDCLRSLDDLRKLCGSRRVWVLMSHIDDRDGIDEGKLMIQCLESLGTQKASFFAKRGAVVYLYDLSTCQAGTMRETQPALDR